MSQIDKRIKVNTIIENQLPEFLVTDFPKATEFLKQYFISQEFQGGATDLISNFDQYLKSDNLVPEVVFGETSLSEDISETDTTIEVPNSKGFPSEYGLLKIDNEIVTYTGKEKTETDVATHNGSLTFASDRTIRNISTNNVSVNDIVSLSSVDDTINDTITVQTGTRVLSIGNNTIIVDRPIVSTSAQGVSNQNPVKGAFTFTHERFFFTGCIRGFSGITGYNVGISSSLLDINRESLKFEETKSSSHLKDSTIVNLSVLFIQEFFKKLKKTFLPGLENQTFTSDLDVGNFIKFSRSFYQSKGIEESIKILFKVLFGVEATILDLEGNLIKPSSAEFIRREVIVADLITPTGQPSNLVGQTIFKSTDTETNGSVSEVEILRRGGKSFYKISLFVGYSDRDLIQGVFTIPGKTKSLENVSIGSSIISVDSTVGFAKTGTLISGSNNQIDYTSKTVNQFFGCSGVKSLINAADDIRTNETIFGYENGDLSKRIDLRITGVLNELVPISDINLVEEGENVFVKNVGEKIQNDSLNYKQIFANSWIYNTSSRFNVDVNSSNFILKQDIDKAFLKVGDTFDILNRNEQVGVGSGTIDTITFGTHTISSINIAGFTQNPNQLYDIRRRIEKVSSSGVPLENGNDKIIGDVLNVYVDGETDGYVASNSLPTYDITANVIEEVLVGSTDNGLEGRNPLDGNYSIIKFEPPPNSDIKFIQGDQVVYKPDGPNLGGLETGRSYFVDPVVPGANQNKSKIKLYNSLSQIGTASTVQITAGVSTTTNHRFILKKHESAVLKADRILRKFPLNQNLFVPSKQEKTSTEIGILINGVQLRSPISDDQIFFGPLESIDLLNGGEGYDIINPPFIGIQTSSGGVAATADPIIQGSVKSVFVDPQNFDVAEVTNISLTGGNGRGCILQPILGERDRFISFDSRNIVFGGGVDINEETITFITEHNLENGQLVYYNSNGNTPIGIGPAYNALNTVTDTLSDGDPYFVRVVNPKTVRIFNTKVDAVFGTTGINTVGLSTDTSASGIHRFRTETKKTLITVKVLNEGSGYTYRKLKVKPTGITTSSDTVNYKNHGFSSGEIVEYSTETTAIQGMSTTTSYLVKKLDDDSFKLAEAGIGGTSTTNFDRGNFVNFKSNGTGFQIFEYPKIKVNINVSYGSTVTGDIVITPVVTGNLIGAYLSEEGTKYGSVTLNKEVTPKITIINGEKAELKPVIIDGRIIDVNVVNRGRDYNSDPELRVITTGEGAGAVVRPVVENGQIIDAIVTNGGIGYDSSTTEVRAFSRGVRGSFSARVRALTLNSTKRFGDSLLTTKGDALTFGILSYSQDIAKQFENTFTETGSNQFNQITGHSPIIGWAYDGNPIYGPFGYSIADDINSPLKIISTSYVTDITSVIDRPSGYEAGFFVEDHKFNNSGDLDLHNGRFCKTPEFPNGIYAYFTSVGLGTNTNRLEGVYPYFIGNTYRSPFISENQILDQNFDFNSTNLRRNTFPYAVDEPSSDNDFIIESYEDVRQLTKIESVNTGTVDSLTILSGGEGYKVGDFTIFDDTNTNGSGFRAEVSEIVGLGVSRIDTTTTTFENAVFEWKSGNEVVAKYLPFIEVNNGDNVTISGFSSSILNLGGTYKVGVTTHRTSLEQAMLVSNGAVIQDVHLSQIPNTVAIGGSIRVGSGNTSDTEMLKVLDIFDQTRVVRVLRNIGIAHTRGSNVDILTNEISIPAKTNKFVSVADDIVYFNGPQSVGVGTTSGGAIEVETVVGNIKKMISIPTRTIRIPNHPFKTGQALILNKRAGALRFDVGTTPNVTQFKLPLLGQNSTEVFVINKGPDNIGLVTTRVGIGSTGEGLFFYSKGSVSGINSGSYFFESQKEKLTGDIDKVVTTVSTNVSAANTTTHNLKNNDIVKLNVVPNISVGIGTTTPVSVIYNSEFDKLIVNPVSFTSSNVGTNEIEITDHNFKTGDKVFYDGGATGIETGAYFIYEINSSKFNLVQTIIDLNSDPVRIVPITANTGGNQTIGLINPRIDVVRNSKLKFGLSNTSLAGFDFKIFYDKNLTNEYFSSQDSSSFNVGTAGTIGIGTNNTDPVGASLEINYSESTPGRLFYGLTKGGFISTADTEVSNYSEIRFINSKYNGEYQISNVSDDTFDVSPTVPEFSSYTSEQCDILEYSTQSKDVIGAIKKLDIISSGFNYKKLPKFRTVSSVSGNNANIIPSSRTIGRIKKVRIADIGYEYSADKTLSPEAFVSPVLNLDNLDVISNVEILSGGNKYVSPPKLIVFNPVSNTVVDSQSLLAKAPNQTVSKVDIIADISGLDSVVHKIVAINNTNGIGINSVQTSNSGVVTCFLETPINNFSIQPFAKGDEIFVEGIQRVGESGITTQGGISTTTTVEGEGFNSENHNYSFFNVDDYIVGVQNILKFSVAGVTTNAGVAKTFQSGYASLINRKDLPVIQPIQTRGVFEVNESLIVDNTITDLKVTEIREDYIKIDGKFRVKKGDIIRGDVTNVAAQITNIIGNAAQFNTNYSNRQEYGWIDNIGKLNEDVQVTPNNDYYQNLSYSVKSTIEWDKFVNSVNSLVHPSGLKNFADTAIVSQTNVGIGTSLDSNQLIVLDVLNVLELNDKQRVDAINNFDVVKDFDTLENETKSKFLTFKTRNLTDFTRCKTNRVLLHDDISDTFSSDGFESNSTVIEPLKTDIAKYLIQIVDPDTSDAQFNELVILTTEKNALLFDKTENFTSVKLGDYSTQILNSGTKNLVFTPTEPFTKDHDIKIIKTEFNTDLIGINTTAIGNINLTGVNVGIGSTTVGITTNTIVEYPKTNFNSLHASIFVQDSVTKEVNYSEVIVDFDGTDTTIAETYVDTQPGVSNSVVGIITAKFENNLIKLQCENDRVNTLDVRANIVGLGTTTTGISTFRYLVAGQPEGTERSARYESGYATGTASTITFATLNKNIDSSAKSIVRVSCGETSAVHQIIALRDADDILTVQYPFVSAGSTTGIGTFGGEISGNDINLRFYPDAEFNSLIEVQSFNQILYTSSDFDNEPPKLTYGTVDQSIFLSTYDGASGLRANKKDFDLKHDGTPIYSKTFNPSNTTGLAKTTGIFTIPNHFFNTNEELVYKPDSTFIGIAGTAVSIGSTQNIAGIVTDQLPSTVFVKVIDENQFQLFTRPEFVSSGAAVTFTGNGGGNAHKLSMTKPLTKTIIGLDGVVQTPINFTNLAFSLGVFDGFTHNSNIGIGLSQFVLSGISSIQPRDFLKINDEYVLVTEVGFSSTPQGIINDATDVSLGISTLPVVKVRRGQLGIAATSHVANDSVQLHRGSFNIVESKVFFAEPPKGNARSRRDETNLPFVRSKFSGRTFLRSDYTTNMLFDDLSDNFTGIGKTYTLTVGGANTSAGVGVGNGVLFINGIFQTPKTVNNTGNNYEFSSDPIAGISTVEFTGITSTNGDLIVSEFDINQNQVPRGGLIVSLGSTPGLGYAPLQGAKVKAFKNASGGITSVVGIATSSGFNLGIQTAAYDNITGIITVTTDIVHGFGLERPNMVKLKNLNFNITGVGATLFANHDRSLFVVGIVSDRTFEVKAGVQTQNWVYTGGGNTFEFFEDLTFGSGYRGGSVAVGVTDQAYEHRFVSSGIGSIKKGSFAATGANAFTATNAVYTSHTGTLVLTIPNHGLTTSDTIGIDTGGLVFKCSKDNFFSDHPYPRAVSKTSFPNSDPIAGIVTGIGATTLNTITLNAGVGGGAGNGAVVEATVGVGGTLSFNIVSAGTSYVNPEIIVPQPNYENMPVIGVSRVGQGPTTDTGKNLLLDLEVGAARTTGIGSTSFEISKFSIVRPGHSFKVGDKFKPVGLVTAAHLSQPIQEFELEVIKTFTDSFSSWQFGELDFIDSIKNLQDGARRRFPLVFNGQLLSFEKDPNDSRSQLIDLNSVLLIFINGVLQIPGENYIFNGGTTFELVEPPRPETSPDLNDHDHVDIFFYKGQDGVDVDTADVFESVKIGDELRVFKDNTGITTSQQQERTNYNILSAKLIETELYTELGIDETNEKPVRWTKQKVDLVINGRKVDKSREILEPQIYPTAKIIGDFTNSSGIGGANGIFVDDAEVFFYEKGTHLSATTPNETDGDYNLTFDTVDALVTSGEINVAAAATAIVSIAGTISGLSITEAGSGYTGTVNIGIEAPVGIEKFVGLGTTATATATITNGKITSTTIVNPGAGYTFTNPPSVIIELPPFKFEKITSIDDVEGFTGIITGISTTTVGTQSALKFFFHADKPASTLLQGYPVFITDTKVGNGITSVDTHNSSIVGIGSTFLDNIYKVHSVTTDGAENGQIVCNIQNGQITGVGAGITGNFDPAQAGISTVLGRITWGRLYNLSRGSNPVSIAVTGLTVNSGLDTFPTIQRKNFTPASLRGLRSSGAIRVFGL